MHIPELSSGSPVHCVRGRKAKIQGEVGREDSSTPWERCAEGLGQGEGGGTDGGRERGHGLVVAPLPLVVISCGYRAPVFPAWAPERWDLAAHCLPQERKRKPARHGALGPRRWCAELHWAQAPPPSAGSHQTQLLPAGESLLLVGVCGGRREPAGLRAVIQTRTRKPGKGQACGRSHREVHSCS